MPNEGVAPSLDMDLFGQRLGERLRDKGWTPNRLAKNAGVSGTYMRRLVRGDGGVGLDVLDRMARALGADLVDLIADPGRRGHLEIQAELTGLYELLDANGRLAWVENEWTLARFQRRYAELQRRSLAVELEELATDPRAAYDRTDEDESTEGSDAAAGVASAEDGLAGDDA